MDHLHELPSNENGVLDNIFNELNAIDARFKSLDDDFTNYNKDMVTYADYIKDLLKQRGKLRYNGNQDNKHNKD